MISAILISFAVVRSSRDKTVPSTFIPLFGLAKDPSINGLVKPRPSFPFSIISLLSELDSKLLPALYPISTLALPV